MGYHLNCLDEPVFMAVPKPMLTEFGIDYRLESCVVFYCTVPIGYNDWPPSAGLRSLLDSAVAIYVTTEVQAPLGMRSQ